MPDADEQPSKYVHGPTYARRRTPRFETKPSHPDYTGGGYEHARSAEHREHTPGDRSESVYASIHRLCAVAWCYPDEWSVREILDDLAGKDVHHNAPEADGDRGIPWDNRECVLEAIDHGRHAEITNTQRRAWAEDAKREIERRENEPLVTPDGECDRCGTATDGPLATSDDWDGEWCIECVQEHKRKQQAIAGLEELEAEL